MTSLPVFSFLVSAIFLCCIGLTVGGALIAVQSQRIIRSVCGLAICCLGLAGLYYFLHSPFLALMEILIYIGAVCVTIVFAVMLAEPDEPPREETRLATLAWGGLALAISVAVFCGLSRLSLQLPTAGPVATVNDGSVKVIGLQLLTTYSLAFELISLALLVAILGALVIARTGRTKE